MKCINPSPWETHDRLHRSLPVHLVNNVQQCIIAEMPAYEQQYKCNQTGKKKS